MLPNGAKPGRPNELPILQRAWGPSGADLSSPSHILPHTLEAGDPYCIGDVYEKSRISPSGEWINPQLLNYKSTTKYGNPFCSLFKLLIY